MAEPTSQPAGPGADGEGANMMLCGQILADALAAARQALRQIAELKSSDGQAQLAQAIARDALACGLETMERRRAAAGERPDRGRFWVDSNRFGGTWVHTLRTMGDWPNPAGIEVARLNSYVMARYPGLGERIANACTTADSMVEVLQLIHEHCAETSEMPADSKWLKEISAEALLAAGHKPRLIDPTPKAPPMRPSEGRGA